MQTTSFSIVHDSVPAELLLLVGHTSEFTNPTLAACRLLLDDVFDDMTDHDWEHAVGGMHAVATCGGQVVGHASVIQRRLIHQGRAWRTGYVEGVGVHPRWQRCGIGCRLMAPLEWIITSAYDLGALGATDEARTMYEHRGWKSWAGPTSAVTPAGIARTPDEDDCTYVLPASEAFTAVVDFTAELTCDWRDGDVW
jgi:aminoglycoside 2'-N-acetyltransferase I